MGTTLSMWLGISFLALAVGATILQAWLWSFPMAPDPGGPDPNGKTTAPRLWTNVHRGMGLAYTVIYFVMMWEMLPRLWEYQVELPARTVIHACVGIIIGCLLITKIAIIKWFQHFGKALPQLGLTLLICTVLLGMLSLPFAIQAHSLSGEAFEAKNLSRVKMVLSGIDLGPGATPEDLVQEDALVDGREVLMRKCSVCHDMRTILVKPRTGSSWHSLVKRMAEKPMLGPSITDSDVLRVTSYLVAISPNLQESVQVKRRRQRERKERIAESDAKAVPAAVGAAPAPAPAYDPVEAKSLFETRCSECHELSDVDEFGGSDAEGWTEIVRQMVEDEEAELTSDERIVIARYLTETYPEE